MHLSFPKATPGIIARPSFSKASLEDLLSELISSFKETSSKEITLHLEEDKNKIFFERSPEIIYGLRNFIGNSVKFSKTRVKIMLSTNKKNIIPNTDRKGKTPRCRLRIWSCFITIKWAI